MSTPVDDLLDAAPCGFLSFADDGSIRYANRTLLDLLGYERESLVGRPIETILGVGSRIFYQTHLFPLVRLHGHAEEIFLLLRDRAGEDVGMLLNAIRRERDGTFVTDCALMHVRERRKFEDELLRARRAADEARAQAETRSEALRRANDKLEAQALELEMQQQRMMDQATELEEAGEELRVMNEELTVQAEELERQRAAADEANQAKSRFLAVASHELRTPLNAIAGYVQLVQLGVYGPVQPEQVGALERIARSQRHLLGLINDILNLTRIEAGRIEYSIEDVRLSDLVATVMPMIEPQLEARGLTSEVRLPGHLVARADCEKVQQILLNLLSNAVKFTDAGGRITIDAGENPDRPEIVFLRVSDTGIGIPEDMQERVFEPFVQVNQSLTRNAEGTGLGLSISRDLARGMGGDLRARGTPGQGSTFTLTLCRGGTPLLAAPTAQDPPLADARAG